MTTNEAITIDGHPSRQLLTKKQVCELLQISSATLYRAVKDGRFPAPIKIGFISRWDAAAIAEAIDRQPRGVMDMALPTAASLKKRLAGQ